MRCLRGDTDDEEDSLEVVRPAVTRDAAAAASSASAAPSVKSEAELARAAGVMVSPEEVAAGGVAAETASPAVKADAVEGSSGPAVSRDAARRVKGKKVVTRRGGPQNRSKVVRKKILKKDKEINKAVTFVAHLKVLRETLTGRDPRRPTFQEYTAARNALRKKLPPGSAGDRMFHKMVGEACTTCHERHEKGKAVVRAYAALKAARDERGSRTAVLLKPAPSAFAVQSELDAPDPGPSVPLEREPAVPSERGGEERPDDRPKCPDGHVLEEGYCDVCNGIFSRFANMMSCFQCQFYMCEGCYVKRKRAIREELKIDFRYTPEEERRPPAVVLSGRLASTPAFLENAVVWVRLRFLVNAAKFRPPGRPKSRRTEPSRNKMPERDDGPEDLPSPRVTFAWGSWVCPKCSGVNVPNTRVCGHAYGSSPCDGSFWDATEWAPYAEPAVPGGTREERREERRRVKVRALDLALKHGTWMCRRCGVENLKNRNKCFRCYWEVASQRKR